MPRNIWDQLATAMMLRFRGDFIREELTRRELNSTGTKEELVKRLEANIEKRGEATPRLSVDSTEGTGNARLPFDTPTLESLTLLLQQLPCPLTTIATISDLSSLIAYFRDYPTQNVNDGINDIRRVQQLAAWDDATTRLIAASNLKGPALNFHLTFARDHPTWETKSAT
ncbi:hypothetical protein MRX96_000985 [Rhipicephalus microplus]